MAGKPVNKWVQALFWPISVLPSFGNMGKHSADDYVGRTSPILGTAFAFWIGAIAAIGLWLAASGMIPHVSWRGIGTAESVVTVFLVVIYAAGFWLFANREEDYPD